MEAHKYHVDLEWKMDRKGEISSPVLDQKVEVATPPDAAVSSCFMTTFLAIAENSNLEFKSLTCPAEGILDKKGGKFAMTEIILKPVVTIPNEAEREKAEKIMIKAERACLISNSITSKVHLKTKVFISEKHTA